MSTVAEDAGEALAERNYYRDPAILRDPYAFFDALRDRGPVYHHPELDVVFVTGFAELIEVALNNRDFSAVNSGAAGALPVPFVPAPHDVSEQIEAHRADFPGGDLLTGYDGSDHAFRRSLVTRLFTPTRLRAIQPYIEQVSRDLVGAAVARGGCDLIADVAGPLATLVIASLLGVPDEDRQVFADVIAAAPPPGSTDMERTVEPMMVMSRYFARYVAERRADPQDDVLSELANGAYPDGTVPPPEEIVKLAVFLFGAGQDTTVKLLGNAMRYVVETPGLQARLRADRALVPVMLEEVLRLAGSAKCNARLARHDTTLGGMPIKAGTQVVLAFAAANRDPRRWDDPNAFRMGRPKINEHLAFSRGPHVCAGAPLARLESRIAFDVLFDLTNHIDIDEDRHGPPDARRLDYEPSFILRGFAELYLKLS